MLFHYCSKNRAVKVGIREDFVSGIKQIRWVERSPEKAGVGGSIPSLATMFSITYKPPNLQFRSISFQFQARQNSLMEQSCGRTIVRRARL